MNEDRPARTLHPVCRLLKELRKASGLSLDEFETRHGVSAVALGSYERGDRTPPLHKLDQILELYGYQLAAVPRTERAVVPYDKTVDFLRHVANQLEEVHL